MSGQIQSSEHCFWFWDKQSLAATCVALYSSFLLFRAEYFTASLFYWLIKTSVILRNFNKQFQNLLIISLTQFSVESDWLRAAPIRAFIAQSRFHACHSSRGWCYLRVRVFARAVIAQWQAALEWAPLEDHSATLRDFLSNVLILALPVNPVGFCDQESAEDADKRQVRKRYITPRFTANPPVLQADNHNPIVKNSYRTGLRSTLSNLLSCYITIACGSNSSPFIQSFVCNVRNILFQFKPRFWHFCLASVHGDSSQCSKRHVICRLDDMGIRLRSPSVRCADEKQRFA